MTELLLSPANFWFSIALCAVFVIFVLELISMQFGVSLLGIGDDVGEIDTSGLIGSEFASWLNIHRVPFLVWLVVLLTFFSLTGLVINGISSSLFSTALPGLAAIPIAFIISLIVTSKIVLLVARVLPSIESSAVSTDEFVGAVAEITIGRASRGNPAEAKFIDSYSQPHFVLVEPFEEEELFAQGERVILVKKDQHSWLATRYL